MAYNTLTRPDNLEPGLSDFYFSEISAFDTIAIALANSQQIVDDHTFISGEGFKKAYIIRDKHTGKGSTVGEFGSRTIKNEFSIFLPGINADMLAFVKQALNDEFITLHVDADCDNPQTYQLGNACRGARISFEMEIGTFEPTGEKGFKGTVTWPGVPYIYEGVRTMKPAPNPTISRYAFGNQTIAFTRVNSTHLRLTTTFSLNDLVASSALVSMDVQGTKYIGGSEVSGSSFNSTGNTSNYVLSITNSSAGTYVIRVIYRFADGSILNINKVVNVDASCNINAGFAINGFNGVVISGLDISASLVVENIRSTPYDSVIISSTDTLGNDTIQAMSDAISAATVANNTTDITGVYFFTTALLADVPFGTPSYPYPGVFTNASIVIT